jgi:hypothetical protein
MVELQVLLVPVSAGFLGLAFYTAYWRGVATPRQRSLLWMTTPVTVFFWILPHLAT